MLKADQTRSIAESARNQIERELKAKKEFEEKSAQDFDKKLLILFECALEGKTHYFFAEDEFVNLQLNMFSKAGFDACYHKANRNKEVSLRFKLDEASSIFDRLLNQLKDYPLILANIFPGYMAAPSAFINLLNKYWHSEKLNKYSVVHPFRCQRFQNFLLQHNKAWREDLFKASPLLDKILFNFHRLKVIELEFNRISRGSKHIPKDVESGLLISWGLSEADLVLNDISVLSPECLSWVSSENGQVFLRKLEELISSEARKGIMVAAWKLYNNKERWIADVFEDQEKEYWVDDLGMTHHDSWLDDDGDVHYKCDEGDELISVPPPSIFAEILSLTGYKAEIIWKPPIINEDGEEEEDESEVWDAEISISW